MIGPFTRSALPCLLAAGVLGAAAPASATLIASDSFTTGGPTGADDYAVNTRLVPGQSPTFETTGFDGSESWFGNTTTRFNSLNLPSLTHPLASGSSLDGVAGDYDGRFGGGGERINRRKFQSVPDSPTYFYSFLLNANHLGIDGTFGLTSSTQDDQHIRDIGNGVHVGVGDSSLATDLDSERDDLLLFIDSTESTILADFSENETYFVLVSIINNAAGADTVTASVFDTTASLATPSGTITGVGEITDNLTRLALSASDQLLNNGDVPDTFVDEFRFGTELTDVAVVPEPASLALLGLGTLCLLGRRRA